MKRGKRIKALLAVLLFAVQLLVPSVAAKANGEIYVYEAYAGNINTFDLSNGRFTMATDSADGITVRGLNGSGIIGQAGKVTLLVKQDCQWTINYVGDNDLVVRDATTYDKILSDIADIRSGNDWNFGVYLYVDVDSEQIERINVCFS